MRRGETKAMALGVFAALSWSLVLCVATRIVQQGVAPLVVVFHLCFWGAAGALVVLLLTGRTDELSVFKRKETHFLALLLTGGYGLWVLQTVAMENLRTQTAYLLFYSAPLMIGALSLLGRERATAKQMGRLVMGFVGCIMILVSPYASAFAVGSAPQGHTMAGYVAALGWAACWALFSHLGRPLVREEKVLPVAALVLGGGCLCLLATCVSAGKSPLAITGPQLAACVVAGVVGVTGTFGLWLKCLSKAPVVFASLLWYLGALFSVGWAYWFGGTVPGWWTVGGAALILLAVRCPRERKTGSYKTMGDIIRGR